MDWNSVWATMSILGQPKRHGETPFTDRQRGCEKSLQTGLCAKNKDKTVRSECAEHVRSQLH